MISSVGRKGFLLAALLCFITLAIPLSAQRQKQNRQAVYISFDDAKQVVATLAEILPADLKGKSQREIAAAWPNWIRQHDAEIRARLAQGDEDSMVNFLLFGTSFTKQPRLTLEELKQVKSTRDSNSRNSVSEQSEQISRLLAARTNDLISSLVTPGSNDRLFFARKILVEKGFHLETKAGRDQAKDYLTTSLQRVMNENASYARTLEAARLQGDASEEFAERSRLFRARGLSSDTSLLPNYAIEESLKQIKSRQLFGTSGVQRVAVIGPGLDFTDKQEGYDFYPPQTIQPLAIIDTLVRLGLANGARLEVVTFDLSPRVNSHLMRARSRAEQGQSYIVQLPRDEQSGWKPGAVRYWERFGDQIGVPIKPVSIPPSAGQLTMRSVRIRPAIVSRIWPVDTNIVLQRLDLPRLEQFDLIVATNIFVYYDNFDQSLAMMNVERMLRPGGLMLSNNALLELPFFRVHSVGYSTVIYSDRANDGDHIVWYRRSFD